MSRRALSGNRRNSGLYALVTLWLTAIVVLPLGAVVVFAFDQGPEAFVSAITAPATIDALALTVWTALAVTVGHAVLGTILAFVIVRADFRGRALLDAAIDLPFALPTLLPGIFVLRLLGPNTFAGKHLEALGLKVTFAPPAILIVLFFVTLPFVVRAVEPVLREIDGSEEEAASAMGASTSMTLFRVVLPALLPAIVSGSLQCFARALAEFGSVVVVSGNIPGKTLMASALVFSEVESGHLEKAAAISTALLVIAGTAIALRRLLPRFAHA